MRPTMRPPRSIALFALAAVCFCVTSLVTGRSLPEPDLGQVGEKLAWFDAHRDDYDVLFVGSSRVFRGVVPEVFDREMARRGHPVRSFNFGVSGMAGYETSALARRILDDPPRRLRWVVVELDGWDPSLPPENRFKRRTVAWHDLAETLSAVRTAWASDRPALQRLDLTSSHLLHWAARSTGAGRGRALLGEIGSVFDSEGSGGRSGDRSGGGSGREPAAEAPPPRTMAPASSRSPTGPTARRAPTRSAAGSFRWCRPTGPRSSDWRGPTGRRSIRRPRPSTRSGPRWR